MNIAKLKEIFENCCYENNNEKIYKLCQNTLDFKS